MITEDDYRWDLNIKDEINKQNLEIRLIKGNLVLWPYYNFQTPSCKTAYLGVLDSVKTWNKEPRIGEKYLDLNPYFAIKLSDEDNSKLSIEKKEATRKPFLSILPVIWTGNSKVIARILRKEPFKGMEGLADLIEEIQRPYQTTLTELLERRLVSSNLPH